MEHVLDNPAWNALVSGNKHLAYGDDEVKYFDKEVSPFAAFRENISGHFRELHETLPHNGPILFVAPVEVEIPAQWKVLQHVKGLQMVYNSPNTTEEVKLGLTSLTKKHVPQMLSLTKLTSPGPFAVKTIDFGHYHGVFEGEELVAMAGQRLHPFNYAEVSAVCTHPAHTGKGYARQLLQFHINRIKAASETPFLHVRHDNERAIKVYESLGFATRIAVNFYAMVKQ